MEVRFHYLKSPYGIIKMVEIILVLVCIGLLLTDANYFSVSNVKAERLGVSGLVSACIVTPLLLMSYLIGQQEIGKSVFDCIFALVIFFLLVSGGALAVHEHTSPKTPDKSMNPSDYLYYMEDPGHPAGKNSRSVALGAVCIVTSLVFLGEFVFLLCAISRNSKRNPQNDAA